MDIVVECMPEPNHHTENQMPNKIPNAMPVKPPSNALVKLLPAGFIHCPHVGQVFVSLFILLLP